MPAFTEDMKVAEFAAVMPELLRAAATREVETQRGIAVARRAEYLVFPGDQTTLVVGQLDYIPGSINRMSPIRTLVAGKHYAEYFLFLSDQYDPEQGIQVIACSMERFLIYSLERTLIIEAPGTQKQAHHGPRSQNAAIFSQAIDYRVDVPQSVAA